MSWTFTDLLVTGGYCLIWLTGFSLLLYLLIRKWRGHQNSSR
ncbi:MAG: hypothetical protein AAF840_17950 [Bacteroidota bacterium]